MMTDQHASPKIVFMVVISISSLALIGVASLCATLFFKNYADPAVLSALISITSGLVGALGTILTSTRSNNPEKTTPVEISNSPENPVPVTETKP